MFVDSDRKSVSSRYPRKYPRGESNPYQKFRKLLFYPLNYKGSFCKCKPFLAINNIFVSEFSTDCFYTIKFFVFILIFDRTSRLL